MKTLPNPLLKAVFSKSCLVFLPHVAPVRLPYSGQLAENAELVNGDRDMRLQLGGLEPGADARTSLSNHWGQPQSFDGGLWTPHIQVESNFNLSLPWRGQEARVEFLKGDPDRPLMVGRADDHADTPLFQGTSLERRAGDVGGPNRDGGHILLKSGLGTGSNGADGGPVRIVVLPDGVQGQAVVLIGGSNPLPPTLGNDNSPLPGNIRLRSNQDWQALPNHTLTLARYDGVWHETTRSENRKPSPTHHT